MYYPLLCYGNMLETDRWVSLYWMITVTLSSRFTLLMDTYTSEECTALVFKAPTMMIMAPCSSRMLVPTYSTQLNITTLPTAMWVFTTMKTMNFTH